MTRAPLLLAALVAVAGCGGLARPSAAPEPVRVMTLNVRLDLASDGDDAWTHRRDAVARTIREADVVGVQEATPAMLADLDARLPDFERFGTGRDADGGGEAAAVWYRPARFERTDGGTFWLSETPDVPGSVGWDAALPRTATWVRLREREGGRLLTVVNTHFDHVGEAARRESAALLARRAPDLARGGALVVLGDVNATPEAAPYAVLARTLSDARLVSDAPPTGPSGTWNGFHQTTDRRIDYVFVGGPVRVLRTATLDRTVGDVLGTDAPGFVSDHHAVTATVQF